MLILTVEILIECIKNKEKIEPIPKTHKCLQTNMVIRNSVLKIS